MPHGKNSFVLYHDIRAPLELLTDDQRGKLFLALLNYSELGELPSFDGALAMAFAFVRNSIDRDAAAWESKREKRVEAGRKGGKQTQAIRANACFAKQDQANQAVPVPVPVPVPEPVPVNNKGTDKPRKRSNFTPPSVEDVTRYASENDLTLDAGAFCDYYAAKGWTVGASAMKDWKAAARNWSRRGKKATEQSSRNVIPSADEYSGW